MQIMETDEMVTIVESKTNNDAKSKEIEMKSQVSTKEYEGIEIIEDKEDDERPSDVASEQTCDNQKVDKISIAEDIVEKKESTPPTPPLPAEKTTKEIVNEEKTEKIVEDVKMTIEETPSKDDDDIEMLEDNMAVDLSGPENNNHKVEIKIASPSSTEQIVNTDSNLTKSSCVLEPLARSQQNNNIDTKSMKVNDDESKKSEKKEENVSDKENIEHEMTEEKESGENVVKKTQSQSGAIKRSGSPNLEQSIDYSQPTKKHCDDLAKQKEKSTPNGHQKGDEGDQPDPSVKEYLDKSQGDTPDELKKHIVRIEEELKALDDELKVKEEEWNNMLHLKKVKEEILERLTRRKRIDDIRSIFALGNEEFQNQLLQNKQAYCSFDTSSKSDLQNFISSTGSSTTQSILNLRANMKPADLVKEKVNTQRLQRNILPKPSGSFVPNKPPSASSMYMVDHHAPQQSSYNPVIIPKKPSIHQQQQNDYLNGHHQSVSAMGRQGPVKDVQSIIADFREKHPEQVPRRGRRLRPSFNMNDLSGEVGNTGNSRPSSADSSHSNSNSVITSTPNMSASNPNNQSNVSFKDVLVKFAKMTPSERQKMNAGNSSNLLASLNLSSVKSAASSYPEVTLHPLSTIHGDPQSMGPAAGGSGSGGTSHTNSLLHGILTKNTNRTPSAYNSFSPTLARLLTQPERITPHQSNVHYSSSGSHSMTTGSGAHATSVGVNLTKNNNEITITPVIGAGGQNIYLKKGEDGSLREFNPRLKTETYNLDDDPDDDRLVIDEDLPDQHATGREFHENEVPECQGCKKREAQFVCAGCGNQWYCSRECQVRAWDEHSEVCTG